MSGPNLKGAERAFLVAAGALPGGKTRPTPSHKHLGPVVKVSVRCECGWESANHMGKGARGQALAEWKMHIDTRKRTQ